MPSLELVTFIGNITFGAMGWTIAYLLWRKLEALQTRYEALLGEKNVFGSTEAAPNVTEQVNPQK